MKRVLLFWLWGIFIVILMVDSYFTLKNYHIHKQNNEILWSEVHNKGILVENEVNLEEIERSYNDVRNVAKGLYGTDDLKEIAKIIDEVNSNNNDLNNSVFLKEKELENLSSKREELLKQYTTLQEEKSLKQSKGEYLIDDVPKFKQYPKYPTGCESVALYILLKYYNVDVTVDEIINGLDKGEKPHEENNILYGGNPEFEFIGSPYDDNSYGTYEGTIAKVASYYKSDVVSKKGVSFSNILKVVKEGRPVIVWTTVDLALPYISTSWIYKPTDTKISWLSKEHAVVVIGYNDSEVIISDPLTGTFKYQDKSLFEKRYNYFGKRSIYY